MHSRERILYFLLQEKIPVKIPVIWAILISGLVIIFLWPMSIIPIILTSYLTLLIYHGFARRGFFSARLRFVLCLPVVSILENIATIIGSAWGTWRYSRSDRPQRTPNAVELA